MIWQYRQKNVQLAKEKLCTLRYFVLLFEMNVNGCSLVKKNVVGRKLNVVQLYVTCAWLTPVIRILTGFYIFFTYQCLACEGSVFPFTAGLKVNCPYVQGQSFSVLLFLYR